MAWVTTKDGRKVNTDWFDNDENQKYLQIRSNQKMAKDLNKKMESFNNSIMRTYNSYTNKRDLIPYDEWKSQDEVKEEHYSDSTPWYSYEKDETRYVMAKDVRNISKKEIIKDAEVWKNDDDTYGTGDEAIYIIYDNGTFLNLTDGEPHKHWTKQGIRGVYISTADYQSVWGEEYSLDKSTYPYTRKWSPIKTTEYNDETGENEEGYSNSYSGYKAVGTYKARVKKTITYNEKRQRWDTNYTTIAKSDVKRLDGTNDTAKNSKENPANRMANLLLKKNISSTWEIENYLKGLSATRRSNLAREMGIEERGDLKIKLMAQAIFSAGQN